MTGTPGLAAQADPPELEIRLAAVESRLAALADALRARDPVAIDLQACELHRAAAGSVGEVVDRGGPVPPALRDRLAQASSQVVAQRESLARATAALDRALDVLLPREGAGLYSIYGAADRGMYKSGVIRA